MPEFEHRDLIKELLDLNKLRSREFIAPGVTDARRMHRIKHPTEIGALKCMDGRLNLSTITGTPLGIIQPFRNLGGQFRMGWPYFAGVFDEWKEYAMSRKRLVMPMVTYHYSKGTKHLGCKGFDYDTEAARKFTRNLLEEIEWVYGRDHQVVYPIQVGIETDEDALVFHGAKEGQILDLASESPSTSADKLRDKLRSLYQGMQWEMLEDLLPLAVRNLEHIADIRKEHRSVLDINHQEKLLAIGRGFDFLHEPGWGLIVGPYSPDLSVPIKVAASLLLSNINDGRISSENGVVLMSSGIYRAQSGTEKLRAIKKSLILSEIAQRVIQEEVKELWPYVKVLRGVTNLNTREFEVIDEDGNLV